MKDKLNIAPFYIGQKVVCCSTEWVPYPNQLFVKYPIKDKVYTVNDINLRENEFFIGLAEMPQDDEYLCSCFRPLQQQSYPLMTFKKIVEKEKEEILINN